MLRWLHRRSFREAARFQLVCSDRIRYIYIYIYMTQLYQPTHPQSRPHRPLPLLRHPTWPPHLLRNIHFRLRLCRLGSCSSSRRQCLLGGCICSACWRRFLRSGIVLGSRDAFGLESLHLFLPSFGCSRHCGSVDAARVWGFGGLGGNGGWWFAGGWLAGWPGHSRDRCCLLGGTLLLPSAMSVQLCLIEAIGRASDDGRSRTRHLSRIRDKAT